MKTRNFLAVWLIVLLTLTNTLLAKEYNNTSYYVAYDTADKTEFVLVMPSVNKVYTHKAGHILAEDLKQIDTQFKTFPTYNDGELCFSALIEGASGKDGASVMEGECYTVNFFYTQKEAVEGEGMAFILIYTPAAKVYEGLAGDAGSFKVVKEGEATHNKNSISGDDYTFFNFSTTEGKASILTEEPNSGIYVAQSSETTKNIYAFWNHPLLYNDKVYTRLYRRFDFNVDKGMQVVEYDLSKFTSDTSLDTLLSSTIYADEQAAADTANFNQRYYDLLQLDNALHFSILPKDKEIKSQSGRMKYDLSSKTVDYTIHTDPIQGKYHNTTFDLTRGWFMPFNNNESIAIIEEGVARVMDPMDGASYTYGDYDYLSDGVNSGNYTDGIPPVIKDSRFFFASQKFYSVAILANEAYVDYGWRNYGNDPEYIESDILEDFKALYTGTKEYRLANYGGNSSGLGTPELIVDGEYIYNIAKLSYDNSDNNLMHDFYLLKYDTQANLISIELLEEGTDIYNIFYAYQPYKYKDNLIFKVAKSSYNYLYSYNLTTKSYNFKYQIGTKELAGYMKRDGAITSYIVTGESIILPEFIKSSTQEEYSFYFDLVFKVLDINNGTVLKTLSHKALKNMRKGDDGIAVMSSLSNESSAYFFAQKNSKSAIDKLIIKIDTPDNSVPKSQYRFDNQHSGIITK